MARHAAASNDDCCADTHKRKSSATEPLLHPQQQRQTKRMIASVGQVALVVGIAIVALAIAVLASDPLSARGSSDARAIAGFLEWFERAGGVRHEHIGIATFKGMGKGVLASGTIHEHDQLLFIPMDMVICRETIAKTVSPDLRPAFQQLAHAPDELLTAFVLLEMLKPSDAALPSKWQPYWQLLPRIDESSSASPLFFASQSEVDALQDERMITAVQHERQLAARAFHKFYRLFASVLPPVLARERLETQYRWTRFLVNSRAFTIHGERYLVPFGDVFNGQPHASTRQFASGERFLQYHRVNSAGVVVRADRGVEAGEQVFEDYGDNNNYVYVLHHGFAMAENAFDCAHVRLPRLDDTVAGRTGDRDDSDDDSDVHELKQRVLTHFRVDDGPSVCITPSGRVSHESLELAQFYFALVQTDADEMRRACGEPRHYQSCFLSTAATLTAAAHGSDDQDGDDFSAFVARAVQTQLEAFATTLADDEQQLQHNASLSPGLRHAITFRASRKQILHAALATMEAATRSRTPGDADATVATEHHETDTTLAAPPPFDAASRIDRFERWINEQDLPVNHLTLRFVSDAVGFGTFATKPLARGEPYLSVPIDLAMDLRSAAQSPSLRRLVRTLGRDAVADDTLLFTLHLLDEAFGPSHKTSRWRPYIDVLPSIETLATYSPLFYDDAVHVARLQAADVYGALQSYRSRVQQTYEALAQRIASRTHSGGLALEWITETRFRWATAILDSRSIWWGGQRHLVPLLDMVNCQDLGPDHAAHRTVPQDGAAMTRASWAFAIGEQVVENYAQPNHIYLLFHGFVLAANKHDCAHMSLATGYRSAINALPHYRKRELMEMLEALALKTWTPELCVEPHDSASVARFAKVAFITETPLRALDAAVPASEAASPDELSAGRAVVARRLAALETGVRASSDDGATDHRLHIIRTYLEQQLKLFAALDAALQALETPGV